MDFQSTTIYVYSEGGRRVLWLFLHIVAHEERRKGAARWVEQRQTQRKEAATCEQEEEMRSPSFLSPQSGMTAKVGRVGSEKRHLMLHFFIFGFYLEEASDKMNAICGVSLRAAKAEAVAEAAAEAVAALFSFLPPRAKTLLRGHQRTERA